ncbi:phage Gp37/Gp68 family protein [Mesorhizobium sp.]|uniref:DUF5131 family protein n=1 Tax=Mesorhizobium sp. TaxID=1871066 RepID=UPI001215F488|nr:phage Gp37/Gp68 family protein [Mesorhizobium sp.]TIN05576.1 MAG: phage Gp37/Gp68 family protein [Mesorhizobium sp.]
MADKSAIEWTDATWNPIVGCSILSPGCTHCYAMGMAARIEAMTTALQAKGQTGAPHYAGTTRKVNDHAVWTGKLAIAPDHILREPLSWKKPRRIFVNSMGDLFHEDVPDEWIDRVFAVMTLSPQHTFQVLTKRAKRMREYVSNARGPNSFPTRDWPLPNVWLGVSAERQQEADERIPELLATPAAIRFVSAEPLLGRIDFGKIIRAATFAGTIHPDGKTHPIGWMIAGGESGPGARPMHPAWARQIRDDFVSAGVPFFFKQWGAWGRAAPRPSGTPGTFAIANAPPYSEFWQSMVTPVDFYPRQFDLFGGAIVLEQLGKKAAGRLLDGVEHNAMPEAR